MDIQECLQRGYLVKEESKKDLIKKELKEAEYDLKEAEAELKKKGNKWAIVKSYYAMFHLGKAICFQQGYREKRHIAVLIILEHLNKKGKLEGKFVNDFKAAMVAREGADYRYAYSDERAKLMVKLAQDFSARIKKLLKEG